MAFKITLSNYSYLAGQGATFWTAGGYQMNSLATPWSSSENGAGYYLEIDLYHSGAIPMWQWTGWVPTDGRQYIFDVGNANLIDNGPLSGGGVAPTVQFYADTDIFNNGTGGSVTLYWQVTGATGISINQGIGSVAASSQRNVNVTQTTVFTLTAVNGYGTTTAQVTVTVNAAPPPPTGSPIVLSLYCTPNPVQKGQAAMLYWDVDPNGLATSVSIDQEIGPVANSGSYQLTNLQASKIYTLTATNSHGTVTVSTAIAVINVVNYFTATPSTIQQGQSTVLAWSVASGQTSISISGVGPVLASGSVTLSPTTTTTYTLLIEGPAGETTVDLTVVVQQVATIISFTADRSSIQYGESVELSWATSGATSAYVDYGQGQGQVPVTGQTSIGPLYADTTVILTAQGATGPVTRTLQITVGAAPPTNAPVINSFTATPASLDSGGSVVLAWDVTDATSVSINQGVGTVNSAGQVTVQVAQTTVFTLTAQNSSGSHTAQVSVTVGAALPPPVIVSFTATPSSMSAAGPVVLAWHVTGALDISISGGVGAVDNSGQATIQVAQTTTYTLTATNLFGTSTAHVTVTVAGVILPPANTTLLIAAGVVGVVAIVLLARKK